MLQCAVTELFTSAQVKIILKRFRTNLQASEPAG